MKQLFFLTISCLTLMKGTVFAENDTCCDTQQIESEEENECQCPFKFRKLNTYENSVIRVPIEREPVYSYPGSHESSFYEQMTR